MDVEETIKLIETLRAGGGSPAYAMKMARQAAGKQVAHAARQRLEQDRKRVADLDVATLDGHGFGSWYGGPRAWHADWPGLARSLRANGLSDEDLEEIDRASSKIVSRLGDPGTVRFGTRGLVLGHVQSGKTTNYTAVMAKAADAGYRLFIILSGMHNALRNQTQQRLERDLLLREQDRWYNLTHNGDFGDPGNAPVILTSGKRCLAVVKKNVHRLKSLNNWLDSAPDAVRNCAILVIDDECDQASIDVGSETRSAISDLLRRLLDRPKVAYAGYTATPFANVLIDPQSDEDLYPRDFIVALDQPRRHMGTETIFGREPLSQDEALFKSDGRDIVRHVPEDEVDGIRPPTQTTRLEAWEPSPAPSLRDAIRYFILATAARRARGQSGHSSMLIHTTMRVLGQEKTRAPVRQILDETRRHLTQGKVAALRSLWARERGSAPVPGLPAVSYEALATHIGSVLRQCSVVVDNSGSADTLEYGEEPQVVIVIGGNTLSRGLTLEGLVVSYFLRSATAYDTLLQMGRWFGYRPGYEDLPRVWMTTELHDWFIHLATVEAEIRVEIDRYEREQRTPENYAVRIRTHSGMTVTSRAKMGSARPARVSFAGERVQSFFFRHRDHDWLARNLEAGRSLVRAAVRNGARLEAVRQTGQWLLRNVHVDHVERFFHSYSFHENHHPRLSRQTILDYISRQNALGDLLTWNVLVVGAMDRSERRAIDLGLDAKIALLVRSRLRTGGGSSANLKTVMSKADLVADLAADDDDLAGSAQNQSTVQLLRSRPRGTGLLALYPIDRDSAPTERGVREPLDALEDVLGVGIVFPETDEMTPVKYVAAALDPDAADQRRQREAEGVAQEMEALNRQDEEQDLPEKVLPT